jgi:hypothetical protein
MTDPLDTFSNVTIAPVVCRGEIMYELRLYIPNRTPVAELPSYLAAAFKTYNHSNFTLEMNRAGMCFNAFVEVTPALRDAVNHARERRGFKKINTPCLQ